MRAREIIVRKTAHAFRLLSAIASSEAHAALRSTMSTPQLEAALLDAIETLSRWQGPPAERARSLLEDMRQLIDRSGLDDRVPLLAAAILEAFGMRRGGGCREPDDLGRR